MTTYHHIQTDPRLRVIIYRVFRDYISYTECTMTACHIQSVP